MSKTLTPVLKTGEIKDWTVPVDDNIDVPDELAGLFNRFATQMRFHTISGKNEIVTIADMVYIAQEFFCSKLESEGWIKKEDIKLPLNESAGSSAYDIFDNYSEGFNEAIEQTKKLNGL